MFLTPKILGWLPAFDGSSVFDATKNRDRKATAGIGHPYPTKPGVYWFHEEKALKARIVDVRRKARKLVVRMVDRDLPVREMRGHWHGPIP
jgi:hypothetical protein